MIFVFGSNTSGRHGKGAALFAFQNRGAIYGQGAGRQGHSYAIPTRALLTRTYLTTLPLVKIAAHVQDFLKYAHENPALRFEVTRIGCGLAGYTDREMAPLFKGAPSNCVMPREWKPYL